MCVQTFGRLFVCNAVEYSEYPPFQPSVLYVHIDYRL